MHSQIYRPQAMMPSDNKLLSDLHGEVEVSASKRRKSDTDTLGFQHSKPSLLACRYPMKIWIPHTSHNTTCTWLFGVQFGGGLVEGDDVKSKMTVQSGCCALYASFGLNKAYRCASGSQIHQKNDFFVEDDGCLFVLPDPTLLQRGSALSQRQVVNVAANGNVVLLDWYVAGRETLHWDDARLNSVNSVLLDGVEIFRDAMCLNAGTDGESARRLKASMGKYRVIGICIVIGEMLRRRLETTVNAIATGHSYGIAPDSTQVVACSPLHSDISDAVVCGTVIRFCFSTSIGAYESMADILGPVFELAGGNPFEKNY